MLGDGSLTFREFVMKEPAPLEHFTNDFMGTHSRRTNQQRLVL